MNQRFTPPHRNNDKQCKILPKEFEGHYYWLDLIRFLAAFAVMACHFRGALFVDYSSLPSDQQNPLIFIFFILTRLGFESVLIFFVLSGLLVGGKAMKRLSSGNFKITDYVVDRAVRIILPLISSLLFYLPIAYFCGYSINPLNWIGTLFSLQGIVTSWPYETLWSLSYEVWFYIVMFAVALILKQNIKAYYIGFIVITICMLVFTKLKANLLFVWFLGALAFYKMPTKNNTVLLTSFVISIFLVALLQFKSGTHFTEGQIENDEVIRSVAIIAFGFSFGLFLQQIIQCRPRKAILLKLNEWGTKLAAFSYTLYLSHIPVLRLLESLGAPKSPNLNPVSILFYICSMGVAMLVAFGLYWFFERNTGLVKKYIKIKINILKLKSKDITS